MTAGPSWAEEPDGVRIAFGDMAPAVVRVTAQQTIGADVLLLVRLGRDDQASVRVLLPAEAASRLGAKLTAASAGPLRPFPTETAGGTGGRPPGPEAAAAARAAFEAAYRRGLAWERAVDEALAAAGLPPGPGPA